MKILCLPRWMPPPLALFVGWYPPRLDRTMLFIGLNIGLLRMHLPTVRGWKAIRLG